MDNSWYDRVRELTVALVRLPSVNGTADELNFAARMRELLAQHPYFAAQPDQIWIERAPHDPHGRSNLFALVRGEGSQTVVLSGHFDVVSIDNYGELRQWATDPDALLPRLIDDLRERGHGLEDELALQDLLTGDYMPGRGALDMKGGVAAGLAVLYRFAEMERREGNILLVVTPDEEASSYGMRAAVERLPSLCDEWGLEPVAAINMDAVGDRGDGSDAQAIFLGSVGKLLPSVYIVGRETHAGYPYDGVNSTLLAAEVTRLIECNPDLSDIAEGQATPPPVTLTQIDLKGYYDVTTPATVWCAYNFLVHSWSSGEVLEKIRQLVAEGFAAAIAELQERAAIYTERTGQPVAVLSGKPTVLTFAELRERALERGGATAQQALDAATALYQNDLAVDVPAFCRRITETLWPFSGLTGPAAVVGLASLYYPRIHVGGPNPYHVRLAAAVEQHAANVSAESGFGVSLRHFYPGISDMSFLGAVDAADIATMSANTPAWGSRLRFDFSLAARLDLPVVNIGPWGRDYHQRIERVNMPYSFEVVPELIWRTAASVLSPAE